MKIYIIRGILVALLITVLVTIFNFSNQQGDESGSLSTAISKVVVGIFNKDNVENEEVVKTVEGYIRKFAHLSIYAVVGLLFATLLATYNLSQKQIIIYTLIFGILYASSDEIHQKFVADRSGRIVDVYIDNLGVLLGTYTVLIIKEIIRLVKKKKEA